MEIFWITLLTIAASAIGTITGFGISTVMVPVVLFFYPLPETLLLVGVIHWFGDLWRNKDTDLSYLGFSYFYSGLIYRCKNREGCG